jgi:hypothetical protein
VLSTPVVTATYTKQVSRHLLTTYFPRQFLRSPILIIHRFECHRPREEMNKHKDSTSRLLPSTSISGSGEEKGKESLVTSPPMQLPRRRTSTVRVTSNKDSTGSEHYSPTSGPSTPTSASANLFRTTSMAALRSLDTSSNSSLRSPPKHSPKLSGSPARRRESLRSKAPKPLGLDGRIAAFHFEQLPNSQETAASSYENQFRRRRGDLLHRLGPSVPYMQAYDSTSLQWWVIGLVNILNGLLTCR